MKFALCKGRHRYPKCCEFAIFEHRIENVKDISALNRQVEKKLKDIRSVELYTSGLSVALSVVMDYCYKNHKRLTLFHFDPMTKTYYEHRVGRN